jgi:hypothetical protein
MAATRARRYWLRHAAGGLLEVPLYALRKRRWALAARCVASECAYLGTALALWRARPTATLWALLVPYIATSLALMFGNWCAFACWAPAHQTVTAV